MSDQCGDIDKLLILCQTEKSLSNHEATSDNPRMFQDVRGIHAHSMQMTYQDSITEGFISLGNIIENWNVFVFMLSTTGLESYLRP